MPKRPKKTPQEKGPSWPFPPKLLEYPSLPPSHKSVRRLPPPDIDSLRSALAQEQAEPVAWQWLDTAHFRKKIPAHSTPSEWRPLYTAPPQRKPEPVQEPSDPSKVICPACCHQFRAIPEDLQTQLAEPVAWYFEARHIDSAWAAAVTMKHPGPEGKYMRKVTPLYTAPPQRKPLTDEEIIALIHPIVMADMPDEMTDYEIARAIERAHGIV